MKIISFSDVITNSSSEVFVLNYVDDFRNVSDCITIDKITYDYLINSYEEEMVFDLLGYNMDDYFGPDCSLEDQDKLFRVFCEEHRKEIEEKIIGKYFVDIEDHFPDWEEYNDLARGQCIWHDYRH